MRAVARSDGCWDGSQSEYRNRGGSKVHKSLAGAEGCEAAHILIRPGSSRWSRCPVKVWAKRGGVGPLALGLIIGTRSETD